MKYVKDRSNDPTADHMDIARKRLEAIAFLRRADKKRFAQLTIELRNKFTFGTDAYPNDISHAFDMLANYRPPMKSHHSKENTQGTTMQSSNDNSQSYEPGMQFSQDGKVLVKGVGSKKVYEYVKCRNCQKWGHYANRCPTAPRDEEAAQMFIESSEIDINDDVECDFIFAQMHAGYNVSQI